MKLKNILQVLAAALVLTTLGVLPGSTSAHAGLRDHGLLDQTGCKRCQACGYVCKLEAEQVETEKTCFEVEDKVICIPRVVFPWQTGQRLLPFGHHKKRGCGSCDGGGCDSCSSGCDSCGGAGCNNCVHNGARIRKVRVIKKSSMPACPVCAYSWSAEESPCAKPCNTPCGANGCAGGNCDAGCTAPPCDAAPVYVEPQVEVQ